MVLDEHKNLIYVSTHMTKEEKQHLYDIYNRLTGENKKPNGCGQIAYEQTLNIIRHHYDTNRNVKIKGEVYTVNACTELGLTNVIKSLKESITRNYQKID